MVSVRPVRRGGFERANLCVRSAQSGGQHRTAQRSQALICQLAVCQRQLGTGSPAEIAFFPPARSAKHGPGPKHRPDNGRRLRTGHLAPAGISHFVPEISEAFDPPDERFEVNGSNVLRRRGRGVWIVFTLNNCYFFRIAIECRCGARTHWSMQTYTKLKERSRYR